MSPDSEAGLGIAQAGVACTEHHPVSTRRRPPFRGRAYIVALGMNSKILATRARVWPEFNFRPGFLVLNENLYRNRSIFIFIYLSSFFF